jgi:hypothetical protein
MCSVEHLDVEQTTVLGISGRTLAPSSARVRPGHLDRHGPKTRPGSPSLFEPKPLQVNHRSGACARDSRGGLRVDEVLLEAPRDNPPHERDQRQ